MEEKDLIELESDTGDKLMCEVLDYFFYEGEEYAILRPYTEECEGCGNDCASCEEEIEIFAMKVTPEGEDSEVFEPVSEELSDRIIDIYNTAFEDEELEDDE